MLEIGWLSSEAFSVFRVFLVGTPPEVGCIGDIRIAGVDDCQGLLGWAS
jgi:hypothetical protein